MATVSDRAPSFYLRIVETKNLYFIDSQIKMHLLQKSWNLKI